MIESILPTEVSSAESFTDKPVNTLFAEEAAFVARAVDVRQREFATARHCARVALNGLGIPPLPILPGDRGCPRWPSGIVGSITHCKGYRAAAVAYSQDILTIGVDAEPNQPLPHGVLESVSLSEERALLRNLTRIAPGVCWDRLLFSTKESVYKAWYPVTRRWLDFDEAYIDINPVTGIFEARLLVSPEIMKDWPTISFTGRWLAKSGLVVTTITVPTQG